MDLDNEDLSYEAKLTALKEYGLSSYPPHFDLNALQIHVVRYPLQSLQ